jgi:hypothetical protein
MAKGRKTGGRQAGTLNKATVEIRDVARRLLEDPDYQRSLRARLLDGRAPQVEVLLHFYALRQAEGDGRADRASATDGHSH